VFLDKSPRIVAYQLNRLSNAQLLLVDRSVDDPKYLSVYRAILLRPGMSLEHRQQALAGLRAIKATGAVEELLAAIAELSLKDRNQELVFRHLSRLLLNQPPRILREQRDTLQNATQSEETAARVAGFAALMTAGLADVAWSRAAGREKGQLDFLRAVRYVPRAETRSALREQVVSCLEEHQSPAVRQAALTTLGNVPSLPKANFRLAASLVGDEHFRPAAVRTLLTIPKEHWPADEASSLLTTLVEHIESIPVAQRTSDDELDGLQLADELLALVPADRARSLRERLRAVTVRVVQINTVREEMRYDKAYFVVEAGRPVQVILRNRDAMPHNLVITKPGALREVAAAAAAMGNTPGPSGKLYVPDSEKILFALAMVGPDRQERLVFDAPAEPGEYPFLCTFPQHWTRMYGVMVVTEDLDAWLTDPKPPADPLGNTRTLVKNWVLDDFEDVSSSLRGRTVEIGERIFKEATCTQCHKIRGQGGAVGPELTDVFERWKGDSRAVLREVLEPSYKIDPTYAVQTVLTLDGAVLTGIITEQNKKTITIVTNPDAPKPLLVDRGDIDEMIKSSTSMMPKGLLDRFTQDEIFELLAYLQASGGQGGELSGGTK